MRRLNALLTVLLLSLILPLVVFTSQVPAQPTVGQPEVKVSQRASASPAVLAAQDTTNGVSVVKVVDGDTIKVSLNGKTETVRIVGINTPETVDPRKPVECLGKAASDRMKELVLGQSVTLETDPTQSDRDRYGRLLRFVFLSDGTDVGKEMLLEGLAQESLYSHEPHRYRADYVAAEDQARLTEVGLWQPGVCK